MGSTVETIGLAGIEVHVQLKPIKSSAFMPKCYSETLFSGVNFPWLAPLRFCSSVSQITFAMAEGGPPGASGDVPIIIEDEEANINLDVEPTGIVNR